MANYTELIKFQVPTRIVGLWRTHFDDPRESFWMGAIRFAKGGVSTRVLQPTSGRSVSNPGGVNITTRPTITIIDRLADFQPTKLPDNTDPNQPLSDSMPDGPFYIMEKTSGDNDIVVDPNPIVSKGDADFFHLAYRFRDKENLLKNFYGIVVNGHDNVIIIGRGLRESDGLVHPILSHIIPNNAGIASIGQDPTLEVATTKDNSDTGPVATFAIRAARHIVNYNGSVVYGGFTTWNPVKVYDPAAPLDEKRPQDFRHWIVFSDTIGSDFSVYSVDTSTTLQIGDTTAEPITGLAVNSVETDMMGIKGQLLVFTPRKVTYFDGLPPIPDDDRDSNFVSPAPPSPVGTWAPRSIVRTEYGVVFLGTNGMVYLVPFRGAPIPIGRAIEPHLRKLRPFQQERACAEYIEGQYMLSIPGPDTSNTINREQWWADMRGTNLGERDAGVRWLGPQGGPPIGIFAIGRGQGDTLQLMGGSASSSQIFEMFRRDLGTDAPERITNPDELSSNLPAQREIRIRAKSNPLDLGDAHIDKIINDLQIGIGTDNIADMEISISASAVDTTSGEITVVEETFLETVRGGWGQAAPTDGRLVTYPNQGFELITKHPSSRLRGRAFTLEIREKPSPTADKDPRIFFQDISFGVRDISKRR